MCLFPLKTSSDWVKWFETFAGMMRDCAWAPAVTLFTAGHSAVAGCSVGDFKCELRSNPLPPADACLQLKHTKVLFVGYPLLGSQSFSS